MDSMCCRNACRLQHAKFVYRLAEMSALECAAVFLETSWRQRWLGMLEECTIVPESQRQNTWHLFFATSSTRLPRERAVRP